MLQSPEHSLKRPRILRKVLTSGLAMPVEIAGHSAGQLFRLSDNNMAPAYNKGDVVRCSKAKRIKDIQSGSLVVVSLGRQSFFKRLVKCDGHLLLVCDDRNYHLLKVEESEIYNAWSVDAKLRINEL